MSSTAPLHTLRKIRRRGLDLMLDALFVAWVLHVLLTGRFVPTELAQLLHHTPQANVYVEPSSPAVPIEAPNAPPGGET